MFLKRHRWKNRLRRRKLFDNLATLRKRVRRRPTVLFIGSWSRTAPGAKLRITVTSGSRARLRIAAGGHTPTAVGSTRMSVGPGSPKSHLDGRLIIMDGGCACAGSAGCGCRVKNGRRPGSRGGRARITSAGLHCRRRRALIANGVSGIGRTITTISDRISTRLCRTMNSGRSAFSARSFRSSAISRS